MTDVMMEKVVDTPDRQGVVRLDDLDEQLIGQLVDRARSEGLRLTGADGLLAQLTKRIIESAPRGRWTSTSATTSTTRPAATAASPATERGQDGVDRHRAGGAPIPRDRDATFEPQIVKKRQRRLSGVDELVISLYAKGLTHGEICAHLAEMYGATVSKQTISTITDRVIEGMNDWQVRPLDSVYPVIFIDAINVKIREGNVANRPIYVALGVTVDGTRDILGLWAGEHGGGEGAKFWIRVLSDIKKPRHPRHLLRGVRRTEGTARGDRDCVAPGDHSDVHHSLLRYLGYADIPDVAAGRGGAGAADVGIIAGWFG